MYNSALVLNCVAGPEFLTELFPPLLLKLTVLRAAFHSSRKNGGGCFSPDPCHTGNPARFLGSPMLHCYFLYPSYCAQTLSGWISLLPDFSHSPVLTPTPLYTTLCLGPFLPWIETL